MTTVSVDGERLSADQVADLAARPLQVAVPETAMERVGRSHREALRLRAERPVYGRNTGVGANRDVLIEPSVAAAQALLESHATSAGPPRSAERVRAMLLVRLNQLCAGGAGVSPEVVTALARLICDDALPVIREQSGVGTGDLSALAVAALAVQAHSASSGGVPVVLGPDDALPFLSSNAAALADASLGLSRLARAVRGGLAAAALSFAVLRGNSEAFSRPVERVTPVRGARATCRAMRELVGSSSAPALRIQDPYGLRALPQCHGVLVDALDALRETVDAYLNAPAENPVILADGGFAHHGGFHASYLAVASDTVRNAAVQSGQLAMHRLTYLSDPRHTELTPFLGDGTPGASGVMLVEYVGAGALGDLRAAAGPAAVQSTILSRGSEDTASFASLAARLLLVTADSYELLAAAELLAAVRASRMRGAPPAGVLADVLEACAAQSDSRSDRDLTLDLETAQRVLVTLAEFVHLRLDDQR